LAEYIYQKVFLNYTMKQWTLKPEEIDEKCYRTRAHITFKGQQILPRPLPSTSTGRIHQDTKHPRPRKHKNNVNTSHQEILNKKYGKILFHGQRIMAN